MEGAISALPGDSSALKKVWRIDERGDPDQPGI